MLYLMKQVSLLTWYLSAQPCYCCCTYWSRVHIPARYYVNVSHDTVVISDTSAVLRSINLDVLLLQRGLKRFPRMLGVYTGPSLKIDTCWL